MVKGLVEATGYVQQALELMHTFETYEIPSSMALYFEDELKSIRSNLTQVRNDMATLSLKVSNRAQA